MRLTQIMKLVSGFGLAGTLLAAETTVLERYAFQLGARSLPGQSQGAELRVADRFFGNGTARSRLALLEQSSSSSLANRPMMLYLHVERDVRPDEIVLALLVFRVEIRGYDAQGALAYTRDLPGFTFGDSASGRWYERLAGLPTDLSQLVVTFFGNYE